MTDIYAEYALLDAQIADLTAKKESMRLEIITKMVAENLKSQDHMLGKFTIAKSKSWTYPPQVIKIQDEVSQKIGEMKDIVKSAEALAQSTGEAKYTETESLRFTSVKL